MATAARSQQARDVRPKTSPRAAGASPPEGGGEHAGGSVEAPAARSTTRPVGPYWDPRRGPRGRWVITRRDGDVVTNYEHHDKEACRRLAGLRPRKDATR